MGNLQISNYHSRSPYTRKPIFARQNSLYHDGNSRSLSPYLLKTPRSIIYQNQPMRLSNTNLNGSFKNKIYLNSKMIRSVIKDTSYRNTSKSNTSRLNKSAINNTDGLKPRHTRIHTTHSMVQKASPKKLYVQKPFQELSPQNKYSNKNIFNKNFKYKNFVEFQPEQQLTESLESMHEITISENKENNLKMLKYMKSRKNTNKNYDIDGHFVQESQQIPQHHCFCQHTKKQQNIFKLQEIYDNAPTQRKKPVKIFDSAQNNQKNLKQELFSKKKLKNKNENIAQQNRQKCKQIIKRVRNFNQFLNQVKSKLKKQVQIISSNNSSFDNISTAQQHSRNNLSAQTSVDQFSANSVKNHRKDSKGYIKLALRLQNQKIELEKYRKLVQRELSKQHSIQSIAIEEINKQKIITINFQKAQQKQQQNLKNYQKAQEQSLMFKRPTKIEQQSIQQKPTKKLKRKQKINQPKIDKLINYKKQNEISKRLDKINNLFSKIQGINKFQVQNFKQVSEVIQNDDQEFQDEEGQM